MKPWNLSLPNALGFCPENRPEMRTIKVRKEFPAGTASKVKPRRGILSRTLAGCTLGGGLLLIIKSVCEKPGRSRVSTTGPWPDVAVGTPAPPTDSDHDGMPDAWEQARGFDSDGPREEAAITRNEYSNVENYLNQRAGHPVP